MPRFLTALPVYNEVQHVNGVLDEVLRYSPDVLVVDDGSTDGTSELLAARSDIQKIHHERNQGYGAALRTAFEYALAEKYDVLVTIDCDGQHEPQRIPEFVEASCRAHYRLGQPLSANVRRRQHSAGRPTPDQLRNHRRGQSTPDLKLTDAFCGFKAYRRDALEALDITDTGYAMPLEVWVQAASGWADRIGIAGSADLFGPGSLVWRFFGRCQDAAGVLLSSSRSRTGSGRPTAAARAQQVALL